MRIPVKLPLEMPYPNAPADHSSTNAPQWETVLRISDDDDTSENSRAVSDLTIKTIARTEIQPGRDFAVEVLARNRIIAIFHHANHWYAIDGICSHQGGPLAGGRLRDGCVACPWHGWQYELATGIQTINRQPLQQSFPIRQVDDRVEILLSSTGE